MVCVLIKPSCVLSCFGTSFFLFIAEMAAHFFDLQTPEKDYYGILGIQQDASVADIRRARKVLALRYHPDKTSGDPDALAKFKDLQEAYECLTNPATRDEYNQHYAFAEPESNDEDIYDDDDQKIWDGWHASFDGGKAAHSSQTQGYMEDALVQRVHN